AKGVELAKQDNLIERIIANIKQIEVYSKMEVDINIDNKTEIVDKTSNELDKVEDISSSIWAQVSKSSQSFLNQGIQEAEKYELKKKNNNMHYEGKENQNRNIMVTNDMTNNSILKEILQRLDNIERRHIGAIAPNRF
ncbi:22339_t:CDS:2, partial [Gigaspora margarita]